MKKILILVLMALVAGSVFAQETAVKFSGQIEYETSSSLKANDPDKKNDASDYGLYDGDVKVQLNITADEYNTGLIRFRKRTGSTFTHAIDRAWVNTDLAKFFGLPIGWKSQVGLNDWAFTPVGDTKWNTLSRIIIRDGSTDYKPAGGNWADYFYDAPIWGIKESFTFADSFTLNGWFSLNGNRAGLDRDQAYELASSDQKIDLPNPTDWPNGEDYIIIPGKGVVPSRSNGYSKLKDFYIDAVFSQKGVGPGTLGVELAYMLWTGNGSYVREWKDQEKEFGLGDGTIMFALGYTGVNLGGDLSLDAGFAWYQATSKAMFSGYGVNAQLNVGKLAYAVVGLQGFLDADKESGWGEAEGLENHLPGVFKKEILHNFRLGAGVTPPGTPLSVDAGVLLYLGKDKIWNKDQDELVKRSMLNTFDISAALKLGKMEYRLGYLFVPDNDHSIDPFTGGDNNVDTDRRALYFKAMLLF